MVYNNISSVTYRITLNLKMTSYGRILAFETTFPSKPQANVMLKIKRMKIFIIRVYNMLITITILKKVSHEL